MRGSLAARLYARMVALTLLIGLATATALFLIVRAEIEARSDAALVTAAHVLNTLREEEVAGGAGLSREDVAAFRTSAAWRRFAIVAVDGTIVEPRDPHQAMALPHALGFHDFTRGRARWRSFGLLGPLHRTILIVAEPLSVRQARERRIAEQLLAAVAALVIGCAILLHFALRGALSALADLSRVLAGRSAQDLSPLVPTEWPRDLGGLIAALNRLLARVGDAFAHEQSFTDRAAHQLRTPLAALRMEAQVLARAGSTEQREAARGLVAGVDRTSATIDHMLALARLDSTALDRAEVDLAAIAREVLSDRAAVAAAADIAIDFEGEETCRVVTDPAPVTVALAALVENAIVHGGGGGGIAVAARRAGDRALLTVTDRGPGIPAARRAQLEHEGGRADDLDGGLGLRIVRRAMAVVGGRLTLEPGDGGGGLRATLSVPAASASHQLR